MRQARANGDAVSHQAFRVVHSGVADVSDDRLDPRVSGRDASTAGKGNLLLVDPDDLLVDMLETGLSLSRPKWQVIAASHPSEALDVLERHSELDAIITEIVFDGSSQPGKAFIHEAGRRWPEIPIFVMTRLDPEETQGLETAEYIAKPPDIDFIVSRVDRAIRRQKESLVRGISLSTFLQILELEQKTCTVIVSDRRRVGELYLRKGTLMQARLDGTEGQEALFAMLSMREPRLRVADKCEVDRKIAASLTWLLMEWSVREDHAKRGDSPPRAEDE
jgi:DNA-binding response OmpR family regulator